MNLRSRGGKLSFDILAISDHDDAMSTSLSRSHSDPPSLQNGSASSPSRKRKKKKGTKTKSLENSCVISESATNGDANYSCTMSTFTEAAVVQDLDSDCNCTVQTVALPVFGELRLRNLGNVINGGSAEMVSEDK